MTRRLILLLGAATLVGWVSVAAIAAHRLRTVINRDADRLMEITALFSAPGYALLAKRNPEADALLRIPHPRSFEDYWTMRIQVLKADGEVLFYSMEVPPKPFPSAPLDEGFRDTATDRIYTTKILDDVFLQVAQPFSFRDQKVKSATVKVFVPILIFLPINIALSWIVIRRSLRPVEILRREIELRDGGNLSPMGSSGLPAELAPIAASVDRLLERLRTALNAEREFAENSAHELRTPIAASLAQMQRLLAEIPEGQAKTRARGIERSLSNLGHLVEKLRQLAQAESGIGIADHAIDLVQMVRLVIDDLGKKPQFAGPIILDVDDCPTLMRKVDVELFAILLRNLIENALTHGLRDATTTVSVRTDGTIAIANAGPVVPLPELKAITRRFRRGATSAVGSGLGLSIASTVIERIGGSLELASPARGREDGFEAIIRIPRVATTELGVGRIVRF
ncbi:sensor histidine kinase [Mesorhizobium onobrychidis]|uniref:histidine kinase n=1 Tax=Mesorhizobium onobrychidis TaxID=2775404 RepID=A0ABY5QVU0_9HYPH|nr:HAMP domain-containing sensor histidine kinase [Mesorhizobium onobrychidis]UVC15310.1 HAMP domain-containing histidine kinase [Mesorhizobium onobrychidis]